MIKKLLFTGAVCWLFLNLPATSFAQQLTPTVIASGGGTLLSNNLALDFTIGEIATETLSVTGTLLTQGFLQGPDNSTGISETTVNTNDVLIYPNPVTSRIYLCYEDPSARPEKTIIKDPQGRTVLTQAFDTQPLMIDLSTLAPGFYTVTIEFENHQTITKKIIKQ